jgi:hypothetical protein
MPYGKSLRLWIVVFETGSMNSCADTKDAVQSSLAAERTDALTERAEAAKAQVAELTHRVQAAETGERVVGALARRP